MSTPGLYTQVQPLVRQPMDRVFFANTDSEGPESTTNGGILAAQRAVKEVEARLAGKPAPKQKAWLAELFCRSCCFQEFLFETLVGLHAAVSAM